MTEEIMIGGIDVSGCEYMLNNKIQGKQHCPAKAMPYAKETSCICRKSIDTPYNFCKHNPNCHYKQLKRLEFELKVTKADYEASEQENKKQKEYIKDLQVRKDRYYLQVLEYERQVNDWISFYIKVRDIVAGNYEMLESQGLQDLRRIINEVEE